MNDGKGGTDIATVSITVYPAVSSDFSISASPAARNVKAGSSTSYTFTLTSIGRYDSQVILSAEGLSGVSTDFTPNQLTPTGRGVMNVAVSSSVAKGTYTITIIGSDGMNTHSTTVSLKVR